MNKPLLQTLLLCLMAALLATGCAGPKMAEIAQDPGAPESVQVADQLVYEGEIAGISDRARTISITVGKGEQAKVMMVKYDEQTQGVNSVAQGYAAIIAYELRGKETYATEVRPKLAKLPAGVTEIKTTELEELIYSGAPLFLVDSRPPVRYAQSHLPGAHSLPVPLLNDKQGEVLPENKDIPLIFYCGGPT